MSKTLLLKNRKHAVTYHGQALGSPIIRIAQNKKLASDMAKPMSIFENEFLNCAGLNKTRTDKSVPTKPNMETDVKHIPSI